MAPTEARTTPVVTASSTVLAHTPGLVEHGSKPRRELPKSREVADRFAASLRSFEAAAAYPPHRAYLGQLHPRDLSSRPWVDAPADGKVPDGLVTEEAFYGLLALADDFDLLTITEELAGAAADALAADPVCKPLGTDGVADAVGDAEATAAQEGALLLRRPGGQTAGAIVRAHDVDASLAAEVLLENLAAKASGVLALRRLLHDHDIDPLSVDYVLSCSEEAVGDRYQRGGGNLAKAMAAMVGLERSTGVDIKNFCAAPIPALVLAASLISAGVFERVALVAGGSLPKLGMKFQGHLSHDLPVLEDVVAGQAVLLEADDGTSPRVRLDAVGRHTVGDGSGNPQIVRALGAEPLDRVGLQMTDIDEYGTELHNPEITEPQGSGDVAARNYKILAALAMRRGLIEREDMDAFVTRRGMPGYAPTQGHLASAICYLPHAIDRLVDGSSDRVLMMAKGSLFLGRMSQQSDGMSVLLERNGAG